MKICTNCNIDKPLTDFSKSSKNKDGLRYYCRSCSVAKALEWNRKHKKRRYIAKLKFERTHPWYKTYRHIFNRCNYKKSNGYARYGGRGIKCLITINELKQLWFRDSAYQLLHPSIDRLDHDKDYSFDNCRYIEYSENSRDGQRRSVLSKLQKLEDK